MKFDTKTLEVLKNFSSINPSLKFNEGVVLKTVSPNKTILAKATVPTEVEQTFCIGELSRFMSALSLFEEPEVKLGDTQCEITDGKNTITYTYTSPELIKLPPEKDITFPTVEVQFTLTNETYQSIRKAMSVLSLQELAVVGENGALKLKAFDSKGVTKDNFSLDIGETEKKFIVVFKAENLKLMPFDYEVNIGRGISWFKSPEVEYWIAIESAESKFE